MPANYYIRLSHFWSIYGEEPLHMSDHVCRRARSPGHKGKRPNFFFALQVSQSAAVTAAIKSVHDSLVQHARDLQAALVEPETAHLTVMVTALISEEEIQHAEAAMESFADQLAADAAWTKPLALTLEGLSHFRHQVLQLLSAQLPLLQGVQRDPRKFLWGLCLQTTYISHGSQAMPDQRRVAGPLLAMMQQLM